MMAISYILSRESYEHACEHVLYLCLQFYMINCSELFKAEESLFLLNNKDNIS